MWVPETAIRAISDESAVRLARVGCGRTAFGLGAGLGAMRHPMQRRQTASMRLRGEPVLADQPAEQITAADTVKVDDVGDWWLVARRQLAERRPLPERAVWPMLVVMPDVGREDVVEVAAAEDQHPVEALAADAADPALGVRPRLRRPHRRLDHPDPLGAEDLVELAGELAVAVADRNRGRDAFVVELHQQVARLLGHPAAVRVGRDPGEVDAAGRELDEEQDVEPLQEERVDGEEVALENARRLLAEKLGPARLEPPRRGLDPRLLQDRPDRARGELDPEPDQLALDPPVAPARVLPREPRPTSARISAASPAGPDADADTSSGARPAPDASAAASPASRTPSSSTPAAATPG